MMENTLRISLLLTSALLLTGCIATTQTSNDGPDRDVHYQVTLSEGITGYAEYTIATDQKISHSIPNEWVSNTFTLEAGSDITFILNGDAQRDETEITIRIFADDHQAKKERVLYRVADSGSYKLTIPVFHTLE
jgi:hypothetical protein